VHANREYNLRNGFGLPFKLSTGALMDMMRRPRWLCGVLGRYVVTTGYPKFENYPAWQRTSVTDAGRVGAPTLCESLSWPDIAKLRDLWPGTFIVKGIMSPQDAVLAFKHGADAVVLSNHGGRNLDSSLSTIEVLPEMVAAVGAGARIILDSGIRRGADIAKALALGAHGVLIGRAPLYGAAVAGQAGAAHAIALLKRELETVMAMTGRPRIADLTPDLIR
jgi:isopentenyl diphosphate isomerase/L-lactate dehydrogenase-like FMN-dependent dehydrogenase